MKFFLLLAFVVFSQASINVEWEIFKKKHGKSYQDSDEELHRKEIFFRNKFTIDRHNENYNKGLVTFYMKMNHFGDLEPEEIRATMNRYNATNHSGTTSGSTYIGAAEVRLPDSVDWRKLGAVTRVKDQGKCGSCWAFSSTGSLEGQNFVKTGKLVSLSEQNLIDCSNTYGNQGCDGGISIYAFEYVKDNGGIDSENDYPYEGLEGSCRFKLSSVNAVVTGYVQIPQGNEEALQRAVATVGPISAAIDAGLTDFHFYSGGVYHSQLCSNQRLDHGVLVVGYGSENGQDYWLVKNSWNSSWGEQGYVRMARNKNNNCGIATQASYPLV